MGQQVTHSGHHRHGVGSHGVGIHVSKPQQKPAVKPWMQHQECLFENVHTCETHQSKQQHSSHHFSKYIKNGKSPCCSITLH